MRPLLAAEIFIVALGCFLILFGPVYPTSTVIAREYECGPGCAGTVESEIGTTYYLYPVWSPPNWSQAAYGTTSCSIQSWYTPLNPPQPCVPAPLNDSANYILVYVGVIWVAVGILMLAVTGRTKRNLE